jgi:hypothetical protein
VKSISPLVVTIVALLRSTCDSISPDVALTTKSYSFSGKDITTLLSPKHKKHHDV